MKKGTLGVIIGHRGCFPGGLAEKGRQEVVETLRKEGIDILIAGNRETKYGAIENLGDAKKCANLFRQNREKIDGILISLPNFGDERAIAETIKMSGLNVPILVQAYPDRLERMEADYRRDSFCGKLSVCNNLRQYGITFSLTEFHTVYPASKDFLSDLRRFMGVCRVVKGIRQARVGAIGARTTPFKTVRFSEKLLQESGISVETLDLSEVMNGVAKLKDSDKAVGNKLKAIIGYCATKGVPASALLKMAKVGLVIDRWVKENDIHAGTLQCWSALQDALAIFPCVLMSMMSNSGVPCACEVDVMGAVAMYALQLASEAPSGLFDWNNNYGDDPDKLVLFHCSNAPKSMLKNTRMSYNVIAARMGGGPENSYGTYTGRISAGPMTFARISTDDVSGQIVACIGEGKITDDPLKTFGGVGVARIERLQELLQVLCKNGFEHHVAISQSQTADVLMEALDNYLGWNVYRHS